MLYLIAALIITALVFIIIIVSQLDEINTRLSKPIPYAMPPFEINGVAYDIALKRVPPEKKAMKQTTTLRKAKK